MREDLQCSRRNLHFHQSGHAARWTPHVAAPRRTLACCSLAGWSTRKKSGLQSPYLPHIPLTYSTQPLQHWHAWRGAWGDQDPLIIVDPPNGPHSYMKFCKKMQSNMAKIGKFSMGLDSPQGLPTCRLMAMPLHYKHTKKKTLLTYFLQNEH